MRFIGIGEDGKLMPTAPAFKKGELRELSYEYSLSPWWELIDNIPDLVIPDEKSADSVYEETPEADPAPCRFLIRGGCKSCYTCTAAVGGKKILLSAMVEICMNNPDPSDCAIMVNGMTVKELKLFIGQRGVKVEPNWLKADLIRETLKTV